MYYIVGLGNPGEQYINTRHNVGWLALDALVEEARLPEPIQSAKVSGRLSEGQIANVPVRILYPDTYMNHSGSAVIKLLKPSEAKNLIVIGDDVDLPLGSIRISFGRGSGGHNGVESIINSLGTKDFVRIRIGVAKTSFWPWAKGETKRPNSGQALLRHVLGRFSRRESEDLKLGLEKTVAAVKTIITDGYTKAMNRFN